MIKTLNHLKRLDWYLTGAILLLALMGIISLAGSPEKHFFQQQILFLGIGLLLMILVSFFDWRALKENSFFIISLYLAGIALLVGLFFFAPVIREVRRWYIIGPFSFDPVEYVKIVLIILLAKYFSDRHVEMYKFSHVVLSGLYTALPAAIVFFQPDFGSIIILGSLWLGMIIFSGIKIKHLLILFLIGLLLFSLGWAFFLKDYQKARIVGFLEPRLDPQGINWSPIQARIAIGSGGLLGQGIGEGSQTRQGFLSEPETDFIFAAIAEEMGLVGVFVLFLLYLFIIWRTLIIAGEARDNFSRLFCVGFIIILLAQAFVNIAMNQGLLPIVGLPLPLVSYGGSNLVFTLITVGIVQGIRAR